MSADEKHSEYERMRLIEDSFDEKSRKHLLKAGLKRGMECLEVGIGTGSMALWMSEEVGPEGSVVGVELETDHIANELPIELIQGDIMDLAIDKAFDLIHLRYVLIHNKRAKELLRKLYSLLKPGGRVVIEEPDFTLAKWIDSSEVEACKRVNSAICKMFENRGLKAHFGSTSHLSLQEAGFKIEQSNSYLHLCSGNESAAKEMALSANALKEAYIQTGLCCEDDIEKYITACMDDDSLGVYYATVAVTAVKSEEG